jgi:hypothetical protein
MKRSAIAAGSSFIANLACIALATQAPPGIGWPATFVMFYSIGTGVGIALGFFLAQPNVMAISLGASAGAALLCVPVVLVTFGFALLGAPLVFAYVLAVAAGAYLGGRLRRRHAAT